MSIVSSRPTITRKELEGVLDCLITDRLDPGESVKNFETQLAALVGSKYALATNSLTAAYHLAYLAMGIQTGDEIIIPSFFSLAPLSALGLTGATAVLVDVEENSLSPSAEQVREKITGKTKAIVAGHLLGFHASLDAIRGLGVPVIEDISHVIGAEQGEKPVGQESALCVASFAPSMLITTGNGGMAATANSRFFSAMRDARSDVSSARVNFDYSMTDFQGAMGISQLAKLQDLIRRRRDIARVYHDSLKSTPHRTLYAYGDTFTYQSFPLIFDAPADRVEKYWKKNGVELARPVPVPLHALMGLKPMDFPNSDRLSKKCYTIPIYPTLTKKEIEKISRTLAKFI